MLSQRSLAKKLSTLQPFTNPQEQLEQYPTDSDVAAHILHTAAMRNELTGAHVLDLGAGTGILGLGALLMGAAQATLIDIDEKALRIAENNAKELGVAEQTTTQHRAIYAVKSDVTIMNPPFGTRTPHSDRAFLTTAMNSSPIIYSIHNQGSLPMIDQQATQHGYTRTHTWNLDFRLAQTLPHHKTRTKTIPVIAVRLQQQRL